MGLFGASTRGKRGGRPSTSGHCIAEIVLHCAYWKYAGHRRLTGGKRGGFALKGSNWFVTPGKLKDHEWKEIVRLVDEMHAQMRATVALLTPKQLAEIPTGAKVANLKMVYGLAAHDAYHAGQIRTIRGLFKRRATQR
ncbi:MAG: DinB family protein [Planctomycetes bacterium]|nr:DinB family protein [Planctomycetota bacterium]